MKKAAWLFTGALVVAAVAGAAIAKTFFSTQAYSSFSYIENTEGYKIYRTSNQRYFIQEIFKVGGKTRVLFSAKENSDIYEDADHVESSLQLTARVDNGTKAFGKVAWTLNEPATRADTTWNDPSLIALQYDGQGLIPSYRAYDVLTGKLIISYQDFANQQGRTPAPYIVTVPNSPVPARYIGIVSNLSPNDFDEPATPPPAGYQSTFLIKYATTPGLISKWMIQTLPDTDFTPSIMDVKVIPFANGANANLEVIDNLVNLWDFDGKTTPSVISGFAFEVKIALGDIETTVVLPVKDDKLDLAGAVIPARVKISVIK